MKRNEDTRSQQGQPGRRQTEFINLKPTQYINNNQVVYYNHGGNYNQNTNGINDKY